MTDNNKKETSTSPISFRDVVKASASLQQGGGSKTSEEYLKGYDEWEKAQKEDAAAKQAMAEAQATITQGSTSMGKVFGSLQDEVDKDAYDHDTKWQQNWQDRAGKSMANATGYTAEGYETSKFVEWKKQRAQERYAQRLQDLDMALGRNPEALNNAEMTGLANGRMLLSYPVDMVDEAVKNSNASHPFAKALKEANKSRNYDNIYESVGDIVDDAVSHYMGDAKAIVVDGQEFTRDEMRGYIFNQVAEATHDSLLAHDGEYGKYLFEKNTGKRYEDYLRDRVEDIKAELKGLRDAAGKVSYWQTKSKVLKAEKANGVPEFIAELDARPAGLIAEAAAGKPFDDLLEQIESWESNDFGSSFVEGFDWSSALTFGIMDAVGSGAINNALDAYYKGQTLTPEQERLVRLQQLSQELSSYRDEIYAPQNRWSKIGGFVGTTANMLAEFGVAMIATGGIGAFASLGGKAAFSAAKAAGAKGLAKYGATTLGKLGYNAGLATARGFVAAPFMPNTYNEYFKALNSGYHFDESGGIHYDGDSKGQAYFGALAGSASELTSEYFGIGINKVVGFGARSLGRATGLNKVIRKVRKYVPVADEVKAGLQKLGWSGDFVSETLSEASGDLMNNIMLDIAEMEHDYSQLGSFDYWLTLMGTTAIAGAGMGSIGAVATVKKVHDAKKHLRDIVFVDGNLHDAVLSISTNDNMVMAASALAALPWDSMDAGDKAKVVDYIMTDLSVKVMQGQVEEGSRMESFLQSVSNLSGIQFKGANSPLNGNIVLGSVGDTSVFILDDTQAKETGQVVVHDAATNKTYGVDASKVTTNAILTPADYVEMSYKEQFDIEEVKARVADIVDKAKQMDNPTKADVQRVASTLSIKLPKVGKKTMLANGAEVVVSEKLSPAEYAVKDANGNTYKVHFTDIASSEELTAKAQMALRGVQVGTITTVAPSATTEAAAPQATPLVATSIDDVAVGSMVMVDGKEGHVVEITPEGNYNVVVSEAGQSAEDMEVHTYTREQMSAMLVPSAPMPAPTSTPSTTTESSVAPVATTEDGSVDLEQMSPKDAASALVERAGSIDAAIEGVESLIQEREAELAKVSKKERKSLNTIGKKSAEVTALEQQIAFYTEVLNELNTMREAAIKAEEAKAKAEADAAAKAEEARKEAERKAEEARLAAERRASIKEGLIENEYSDAMSAPFKGVIDAIAKMLGVTVEFVEQVTTAGGAKANGKIEGNHVYLTAPKGGRDLHKGLSFLFGHEVTHRMKTQSLVAFNNFKAAVKEFLGEEKWNKMVAQQQRAVDYANASAMRQAINAKNEAQLRELAKALGVNAEGISVEDLVEAVVKASLEQDTSAIAALPKKIELSLEDLEEEVVADFAGAMADQVSVFARFLNDAKRYSGVMGFIRKGLHAFYDIITRFGRTSKDKQLDILIKRYHTLLKEASKAETTGKFSKEDEELIGKATNADDLYSLPIEVMDAEYLEAVERGDMATAQRMVTEAAKLAMPNTKVVDENGNPKVVYHGTPNNFNAFSKEMFGASTDRGIWGNGFYFSDSEQYAKTYEKRGDKQGRTLTVFLNIENPLFISLRNGGNEGAMYFHELMEKHFTDDIYEYATRTDELMSVAQERLTADVIAKGYDGIIVEYTNSIDTEYVAFEPNQIKSADPVTYDDAGNVIPLSERFNPEKEDVRYSIRLPKEEYAKLSSEIMTRQHTYGKPAFDYAFTSDNYYVYDYLGDGKSFINFAIPIVGNEEFIHDITKAIEDGTIDSATSLDTFIEEIQSGKRGDIAYNADALKKYKRYRGIHIRIPSREYNETGGLPEISGTDSRGLTSRGTNGNSNESGNQELDYHYSLRETDPEILEQLNNGNTIKVYRAMQVIDGELYPPMSARVGGKFRAPIALGEWERAEERPDLADDKGYFKLDKGNSTSLKARYNPYIHTSLTPLNDQFSSAQDRPNLVTVEVEIPESELTSGYKADKAKDAVGKLEWKAGVVQGQLTGTRTVILSRWDRPIRIVPDSEVAQRIVEMFGDTKVIMPSNVVTPSLREELEKLGVPFRETDNQGKPKPQTITTANGETKHSLPSLVGVHNISLDKLRKAIKMGGLANPSVAVIDVDKQTHDDYGDYTLVLPKNMVDARKGKNAGTWAGDAWTPTYPPIVKRMTDDKAISRFYKDIDALPEAMRSRVKLGFDSFMEGLNASELAYWYLFDRGYNPALVENPAKYADSIVAAIEEATNGSFSMYGLSAEERAKCLEAYIAYKYNGDKNAFEADMQHRKETLIEKANTIKSDRVKKWAQEKVDELNEYGFDYKEVSDFVRDVEHDVRNRGQINIEATIRTAEKYIKDNNLAAEYDAWRNNLDERYGIGEYIFDGYTNSGNRRYLPHTVENASKWMKKQGRQGAVATFPSFGVFIANAIPRMTTLESIRKRKGLLGRTQEEYDAFREKWTEAYHELAKKLQPDAKAFDDYGYWRLIESVGQNNPKAFIKKEYGIDLTEEDMAKFNEMVDAIRTDYPARYFETKFERPLQLGDFVAAVVPNDMPNDVYGRLKDANVEIFEYNKDEEGSRRDAMQKASALENVRFSLSTAPTFYSNAQYAVQNIKQDKATPEQWLKMIEKAGGLKAGEDKWLGLSDWLKASDKKTLTKDEVLQYIAENDIQIEEVSYGEPEYLSENEIYESDAFSNLVASLTDYDEDDNPHINQEQYKELQNADPDFLDGFSLDYWGEGLDIDDKMAAARYLGLLGVDNEINNTRLQYTTQGLTKKKEIALVVPTIEPYNQSDKIHFGDAGEGRAVAWVRFGDAEAQRSEEVVRRVDEFEAPYKDVNGHEIYRPKDRLYAKDFISYGKLKSGEYAYVVYVNDKQIPVAHKSLEEARNALNEHYKANPEKRTRWDKVLVIDEIQSKRHQEGREKGYRDEIVENYKRRGYKIVRNTSDNGWLVFEGDKFIDLVFDRERRGVPSAPFEKNWAELAFKRMLRYAAENGYDYVAWTTGDQQADRYDIGSVVKDIVAYDTKDADGNPIKKMKFRMNNMGTYNIATNMEGVIVKGDGEMKEGMRLSDITGKALAEKIMNGEGEDAMVFENGKDIEAKSLEGEGLHIGNEGMKAFYDQMLPSFVKKYTKKWGAEVGEVTMPDLAENNTMHAVNVTDSMRESVMQGQPKFSLRTMDEGIALLRDKAREYNIDIPMILVEDASEYVEMMREEQIHKPQKKAGVYATFMWNNELICFNGTYILNLDDIFIENAILHEYAHYVTKHMWSDVKVVVKALNEEDIIWVRDNFFSEHYNDISAEGTINEIISTFVEKLGPKLRTKLFRGQLQIAEVVADLANGLNDGEEFPEGAKNIIRSVIPLVEKNLETIKKQYNGERETNIILRRDTARQGGSEKGDASIEASSNDMWDALYADRPYRIERRGGKETGRVYQEIQPEEGITSYSLSTPEELFDGMPWFDELSAEEVARLNAGDSVAVMDERVRTMLEDERDIRISAIRKQAREDRKATKLYYAEERRKRLKDNASRTRSAKIEAMLGDTPFETLPLEAQALILIAEGSVKIRWNDEGTSKGLGSELGLLHHAEEKKDYRQIWGSATMSFDAFVHQWWQSINGYERGIDVQDMRNALIDALLSCPKAKIAMAEVEYRYDTLAEQKRAALEEIDRRESADITNAKNDYLARLTDFNNAKDRSLYYTELGTERADALDSIIYELENSLQRAQRKLENEKLRSNDMFNIVANNLAEVKKAILSAMERLRLIYGIDQVDHADIVKIIDLVNNTRSKRQMDNVVARVQSLIERIQLSKARENMSRLLDMKLSNPAVVQRMFANVPDDVMSKEQKEKVMKSLWKASRTGWKATKAISGDVKAIFAELNKLIGKYRKGLKDKEDKSAYLATRIQEVDAELHPENYSEDKENTSAPIDFDANNKRRALYFFSTYLDLMQKANAYAEAGRKARKIKVTTAKERREKQDAYAELAAQRQEYIKAISEFNKSLEELIVEGKDEVHDFQAKKDKHATEIRSLGIKAIGGSPARKTPAKPTGVEKAAALARGADAAYWTFETVLRAIDHNAPNGKGAFYKHFMGMWLDANDKLIGIHAEHMQRVANKMRECFPEMVKRRSPYELYAAIMRKADSTALGDIKYSRDIIEEGKPIVWESTILTISNAMYIMAMWRQERYRRGMERHGIKQEHIDVIAEAMSDKYKGYLDFMNWVNDELLPDTRMEYDVVYRKLFGKSMDKEENYFPAVVEHHKEVTIDEQTGRGELPSNPSATKERTSAAAWIDMRMNYFKVLESHLQDMDQWACFAELTEDLNILLSSDEFRKRLNEYMPGMNADRTGTGSLYEYLFNTAKIATNVYKTDKMRMIGMLQKGWAKSNISYRLFTAIKQLSSVPIFVAYSNDLRALGYFAKHFSTMLTGVPFRRAMEISPSFRYRWQSRTMGMDALAAEGKRDKGLAVKRGLGRKSWDGVSDFIKWFSDFGMTPNATVDALACSVGICMIYDYEIRKVTKGEREATDEEKREAVRKAEIAFNTSQQSSENAYLSAWQLNAGSNLLSTYMNASYALHRKREAGIKELWKLSKKKYRNTLREGYGDDAAKKATKEAISELLQGLIGDLGFALMNGGAMMTVLAFIFAGDNDDDEAIAWEDAWKDIAFSLMNGIPMGNLIASGLQGFEPALVPAYDEFVRGIKMAMDGEGATLEEIAQILSKYGVGVDYKTLYNIAAGVENMLKEERDEYAGAWLKVVNAPEKYIKAFVGDRRAGETLEEYQTRILRLHTLFEDVRYSEYYDDEGKYIGDGNPSPVFSAKKAKALRREYEAALVKNVVVRRGGWDEYNAVMSVEEAYAEVCKTLGWSANAKPNNKLKNEHNLPSGISVKEFNAMRKKAEKADKRNDKRTKWVGDDDTYYSLLQDEIKVKQEIIDKYNEYIK